MITVEAALAEIFDLIQPLDSETVPIRMAAGRTLARDVVAKRDQPPFSASVMDGYAVQNSDVAPGKSLTVIGEAAAGHRFDGSVGPGQAVRIFTGAPVPEGADRVVIQEDVTRSESEITFLDQIDNARYVREIGADFSANDVVTAPRVLGSADIALLAAMNIPSVPVTLRPRIALIATGDELVMPGEAPGEDQIIASNAFGLAAMVDAEGAQSQILPIARDNKESLVAAFDLATNSDLVITIGGASVGDHDLVGEVAGDLGMSRAFYKIAMRPGKPLMAGKLGDCVMIGLPGNPVSSMVCGHIFIRPAIRQLLGFPPIPLRREHAILAAPLDANGPREHYMRASLEADGIRAALRQDSALLSVLAGANALIVRPIHDPARQAGDQVEIIRL